MGNNFNAFLNNVARGYASYATRLAKEYAPNNHLRNSIVSVVEPQGMGSYIIRVWATGPDARAREYGSGIWATRGPKRKIRIVPKNAKALVFYWDKGTAPLAYDPVTRLPTAGTLQGGLFIGKKVDHPGVEAANGGRGYITPAMIDAAKAVRERVNKEGKAAIRLDIRAAFNSG